MSQSACHLLVIKDWTRCYMNKKLASFLDLVSDFLIIVGVVLLMNQYVVSNGEVLGTSMEPNLTQGQRLIIDRISYQVTEPNRFDIVAVKFPTETSYWVKRVIGLPGEKVEYINNQLYVNGEKVVEDFLQNTVVTNDFSTVQLFPETKGVIPENQYLVLGDNRGNSKDSRMVGTIAKENILGVARFSIYPLDRLGLLTNEVDKVKMGE